MPGPNSTPLFASTPHNPDSLANLAYAEMHLGRVQDARAHVTAALGVAHAHPLALQVQSALARLK